MQGLADAYNQLGTTFDRRETGAGNSPAGHRCGLASDRNRRRIAEAHAAWATAKMYDWDWPRRTELRRAIELNPSYGAVRLMVRGLSATKW
jgi:hypothetical protein